VILLAIAASLSRLAFAVALFLFPLSQIRPTSIRRWLLFALWGTLAAGLFYLAVTYVEPVRARFFEGDLSWQVGSLPINVMGRTRFWRIILDSFAESPWIGKGAGASQEVLRKLYVNISHPHNDYLRILHDFGVIGLALWILALGRLLWVTWKARIRADRRRSADARVHLAAFLSLIVLVLSMLTDNTMDYVFVMAPQAVLVGMSLGRVQRA